MLYKKTLQSLYFNNFMFNLMLHLFIITCEIYLQSAILLLLFSVYPLIINIVNF